MHIFRLTWSGEPPHARLFVFYLLAVICFAVVRLIQLARRLYARSNAVVYSGDDRNVRLLATCEADIASVKRMIPLTIGISLLVVIGGAFFTWNDIYATSGLTAYQAGFRALEELFARFSLGLIVSIFLYAASSFFEGAVARRRLK